MISDVIKQHLALRLDGHTRHVIDSDRLVIYKNRYCADRACLIREELMLNTCKQDILNEIDFLNSLLSASQEMLSIAFPNE